MIRSYLLLKIQAKNKAAVGPGSAANIEHKF